MRTLIGTVLLAAIYCLALASADAWDIALGLALGFLVLRGFRAFIFPEPSPAASNVLMSLVHVPRLILAVFVEIVRGTVNVARAVLSPQAPASDGFVSIPVGARSARGVDFSGFLNTLSPGSVYIGLDTDANSWVIHALEAEDSQQVTADAQAFYEKYQRSVLP
ncbi:MAG: Na+/H+ antiporter subunit E [Thermomicrobiales bacterium]|nr:Na+/H+ antiporter subunit E [Thermomicrobiales bacterium]